MRVVSLVPSSTETLLGLGVDVIACTRFCEQPGVATVGGTKNPDVGSIVKLEPDLVVMDREENRLEDHDALVRAGLRVQVSDVRSVDDALDLVVALASSTGASPLSLPTVERVDPPVSETAFVPIWRRPWMSIARATYGGSVLRRLGVELVTGDSELAYPTVELVEIARRDPSLVLVPSEPYAFGPKHLAELRAAIPAARLIEIDGQDLFWWGIRTPAALRRLASALAPI